MSDGGRESEESVRGCIGVLATETPIAFIHILTLLPSRLRIANDDAVMPESMSQVGASIIVTIVFKLSFAHTL